MVINTMESSTWVYSSQCAECWTPNNFTSKENQNLLGEHVSSMIVDNHNGLANKYNGKPDIFISS